MSTAKYIVPHVLARFQADHPGVTINLRFGNRQQIADALDLGEIDLAVMGRPIDAADVSATAVRHPPHPSSSARAPTNWRVGPALSIADLSAEPMISREEGSGTRRLMEQAVRSPPAWYTASR